MISLSLSIIAVAISSPRALLPKVSFKPSHCNKWFAASAKPTIANIPVKLVRLIKPSFSRNELLKKLLSSTTNLWRLSMVERAHLATRGNNSFTISSVLLHARAIVPRRKRVNV